MLADASEITDQAGLLRLDGGNDLIDSASMVLEHNGRFADRTPVDFIIKRNPRQSGSEAVLADIEAYGPCPLEGKSVARFRPGRAGAGAATAPASGA